jgi:hypothetical protein
MCEKVEKVTNGKQGRVNGVARERAKNRKRLEVLKGEGLRVR